MNFEMNNNITFNTSINVHNSTTILQLNRGVSILSMLPRIMFIVEGNYKFVHYAYETNPKLLVRSIHVLESMEFVRKIANVTDDGELICEQIF